MPLESVPERPAFFLAQSPEEGPPHLVPEDEEHARRVLRLRAGDQCLGLDGLGRRWPLRIEEIGAGGLTLAVEGLPEREPEPGSAGASLPWIELAVAWPKKARAEDMLGALVQLGVAAITPLETCFRGPEALPPEVPERWWKLARVACKQSRRTWLPELGVPRSPEAFLEERPGAAIAALDPRAGLPLDLWLRSLTPAPIGVGSRERPIVLVVGGEGGFAPEERSVLLDADASPVWLSPHVLRVEIAALAAAAIAMTTLASPGTDRLRSSAPG